MQSRPFGVALLLAGVDDTGAQLYFSDPSGTYYPVKAHAIGSGSEGALNNLKESYSDSLTLAEAEKLAIGALKQVSVALVKEDSQEAELNG